MRKKQEPINVIAYPLMSILIAKAQYDLGDISVEEYRTIINKATIDVVNKIGIENCTIFGQEESNGQIND